MTNPLVPLPEPTPKVATETQRRPRLVTANREQVEPRYAALDDLLPEDHRARLVWEMVQAYDLSPLYAQIKAVEGEAGRPAIDPRLLVAVWLYATLEGVMSGRELAELCQAHLAYQWLLGGVSVNYHTLTDFRTVHEAVLDQLLSQSVAALLREGVVTLDRTAQDGLRLRASAGTSSFHRQPTLETCLQQAEAVLAQQKAAQATPDPRPPSAQRQAAQQRHAQERLERVKRALGGLYPLVREPDSRIFRENGPFCKRRFDFRVFRQGNDITKMASTFEKRLKIGMLDGR